MNGKSHTLNLENFRDMLQICPKLPESKAYKEYHAVASRAEPPKAKTKYKKKADEPATPSKSKSSPTGKGTRLKTPAKVTQSDTKRSKKYFHMSHVSSSGDRVDIQSKVLHEQQQKTYSQDEDDADEETHVNDESEETKYDNDGDDLTYPNLSTYKVDDEEEEEEKADDDEVSSDHRVYTPPDHQLTNTEEYQESNDEVKESEEEQEEEELYGDLNINLQRMQQQSSSVSSDLVSKFINPSPDTGIDSILSPNIQSVTLVNVPVFVAAETPSSYTTIPQPPIPNIQPLQQTPESTTTTTIPTTTLLDNPNFASLFQFDQRVSTLETEMSEFKQTNQFAEAISSILGIVYNYLASNMKDVVFTLKRGRDDQDKDVDPFTGSNRGSKRRRSDLNQRTSSKSAHAEEHGQEVDDLEDQSHQEFNTGNVDETSVREALDVDESQCNPSSSPTPSREWHKTKTVNNRPPQP
nr:hypothetical protein [Tanacetum cinerariifolium]